MSDNIQQMIVDLLNQASIYGKDTIRVQHLRHVQELILRKDPTLLEQFLDEVLAFLTDKSVEVKKTIISFLEEACRINPTILGKVIDHLYFLLHDDNLAVRKKLILSLIPIYKSTVLWLMKLSSADPLLPQMWRRMIDVRDHILTQLNCNNDGLCSTIIKFLETLIITLIQHEQDFPLDETHTLSRNQCKHNEKDLVDKLGAFVLSPPSSHHQLIAGIEALTNITRFRIDYLSQILSTLEILRQNLSSSYTESQINEIEKIIKAKLSNLLKCSLSSESHAKILDFLARVGGTEAKIPKYVPKPSPESKRKLTVNNHLQNAKKPKTIEDHSTNHREKPNPVNDQHRSPHQQQRTTDLIKKLSIQNVVDLVLASMPSLPETMPLPFQKTYTPIKNPGTPAQIEYLAQLLNNQLIGTNHHQNTNSRSEVPVIVQSNTLPCAQHKKTKTCKFLNAIKPIEHHEMQRMSMDSFHRILSATDQCDQNQFNPIHQKIVISLVGVFEDSFRDRLREYLLADVHQRHDLACAWIYQAYAQANGYLTKSGGHRKKDFTKYDRLLCQLLEDFQAKDQDLFSRLFQNAPFITNNALRILQRYCQNEIYSDIGIKILHHFIRHRITIRKKCLDILLNLTQNENNCMRENAMRMVKSLQGDREVTPYF